VFICGSKTKIRIFAKGLLKKAGGRRQMAFMEPIARGFKPHPIGSHQIFDLEGA
jgi:hypothetical protein